MMRLSLVLSLAAVLGAAPGAPLDAASSAGAVLRGTVSLPAAKAKKRLSRAALYRARQAAAQKKSDAGPKATPQQSVVISAHPRSFSVPTEALEAVRIEQVNSAFAPHVTAVTPGTPLHFVNQDGIFHNVFSLTPGAQFNIGRKPTGEVVEKAIDQVGQIELFCDIHPQMNAVVLVLDTPYFTRADAKGAYSLEDLPAGEYEIRVFHPDHDALSVPLTLDAADEVQRDFRLGD